MRRALLVLGMHRSGTSALARVVSLLGARLPKDILPPVPGNNDLGFWEPAGVVALHDEILASAGSRWDDYRAIPKGWFASEEAAAFRARMVELVRGTFGNAELFVVKDPRACRLVPFWLEVLTELQVEPSFLLPFRHPLEVAASLERRDGLSIAESVLIWLRYVVDAERETRGYPRAVVSYPRLLADWRVVLAGVGADLGLAWPRDPEDVAAEVEGFLSPGQRHHRADAMDLERRETLPEWVEQAHAALQRAAEGASAELPAVFDALARPFERGCAVFGPAQYGRVENLLDRLAGVQEELDAERANARVQIEYRDQLIRDLEARIQAEQDNARAQVAYRDQLVEDLRERVEAEQANAQEQIEYRDALVKELEVKSEELESQTAALTLRLAQWEAIWRSPWVLAKRFPGAVAARLRRGR